MTFRYRSLYYILLFYYFIFIIAYHRYKDCVKTRSNRFTRFVIASISLRDFVWLPMLYYYILVEYRLPSATLDASSRTTSRPRRPESPRTRNTWLLYFICMIICQYQYYTRILLLFFIKLRPNVFMALDDGVFIFKQ